MRDEGDEEDELVRGGGGEREEGVGGEGRGRKEGWGGGMSAREREGERERGRGGERDVGDEEGTQLGVFLGGGDMLTRRSGRKGRALAGTRRKFM